MADWSKYDPKALNPFSMPSFSGVTNAQGNMWQATRAPAPLPASMNQQFQRPPEALQFGSEGRAPAQMPNPAPQQQGFNPLLALRMMATARQPLPAARQPSYQEQFATTAGELLKGQLAQAYAGKDPKAINEAIDRIINYGATLNKGRASDYRMANMFDQGD